MALERWPLGFADSPSYAAPLTPWASFPPASTVEGQIRRPEELPHVSLIALGGIWRPLGGRQVLKARYINPVTAQDLSEFKVENIGPFPGGLVRSGMRISLALRFGAPAISTSGRVLRPCIGPVGNAGGDTYGFGYVSIGNSTAALAGEWAGKVDVISNTSANHVGTPPSNVGGSVTGPDVYWAPIAFENPLVDFSQPWEVGIWVKSVSETATNITSVSWSGGVATFVNPSHTLNTGDKTTVAGVSVGGYNGVYSNITRIDANTWSGTLVANPGGAGTGGTSSRISNVTSQSYSLELWG